MTRGAHELAQADLAQRIESVNRRAARCSASQLASDLDTIRCVATAYGFGAMPPVIHAIEAALARGERGPHVSSGLALLGDALRCGNDSRSIAALSAACSHRVAG